MRILTAIAFAVILPLATVAWGDDKDDKGSKKENEEKVEQQKKAALANWDTVEAGPVAVYETKHLIVLAAKTMEKRLKDVGGLLEKGHDQARGVLAFEAGSEPYPGKIAVYLFPKQDQLRSFVRRVERRRVEGEEVGSHSATDEALHAAASPPKGNDLSLEAQAAAQIGSLLLTRRAGTKVPLPDWLVEGFGRATWYRVAPRDKATLDDRRAATRYSGKRTAKDIYDGLIEASEANPLRGSLADYVAYGPYSGKLPAFLKGFEPEENVERKSTAQALESAMIKWDRLDSGWKTWALAPR